MARELQLVDDIDGGPADEAIVFALDGSAYEIDLNTANAKALREFLAPYVAAARKHRADKAGQAAPRARKKDSDTPKIRAWALENGHTVSGRGRVPAGIRAMYEVAQNS